MTAHPTITDPEALKRIRDSWETVRILEARIQTTLHAGLFSLVPQMTNFQEVPDSLLLLFAISVLENTLEQLRRQRVFMYKRRGLKGLIKASKNALPWQNIEEIQKIRCRRNRVAHHHELLRSGQCAQYLDAIENELLAWRVLEHPVKGRYDISFQSTSG
jgi:hypothetical protein